MSPEQIVAIVGLRGYLPRLEEARVDHGNALAAGDVRAARRALSRLVRQLEFVADELQGMRATQRPARLLESLRATAVEVAEAVLESSGTGWGSDRLLDRAQALRARLAGSA